MTTTENRPAPSAPAALVAGSVVAVILVSLVGLAGRLVERAMGARPA